MWQSLENPGQRTRGAAGRRAGRWRRCAPQARPPARRAPSTEHRARPHRPAARGRLQAGARASQGRGPDFARRRGCGAGGRSWDPARRRPRSRPRPARMPAASRARRAPGGSPRATGLGSRGTAPGAAASCTPAARPGVTRRPSPGARAPRPPRPRAAPRRGPACASPRPAAPPPGPDRRRVGQPA